ncbi:uncharacterized protein [Bactrocera oleae]|uniref:uncharacterized protein isoform X2 n=1 Tax=Bactrocera oleae TaxID=104688 RepID=UPI00174E1F21|nr:uncharacterized protein LOC106615675 isoform X2 [Bactrocera oleae]
MEFNNRLLLKIIELAFITSAIVMIEIISDHSYTSQAMLVCGTLTGYLIICCTLLLGHLLGAVIDKRIDCLFSIGAIIMFIGSGIIVMDRWTNEFQHSEDRNAIKTAGVFMLINAFIFLADTLVTLRS